MLCMGQIDAVHIKRFGGNADKSNEASSQFGYLKAITVLTKGDINKCMQAMLPDGSHWAPKVRSRNALEWIQEDCDISN